MNMMNSQNEENFESNVNSIDIKKRIDEVYTDWHLDILKPVENSILFVGRESVHVPKELHNFAINFAQETLKQSNGKESFIVKINECKFRMQFMRENRYAARLIRSTVPTFDDLNIKKNYRSLLVSEDLRRTGGLIIICGQPGAGKSSTLAATIHERLCALGGFCLTIEDPVEFNLFGRHGDKSGWCEQLDSSETGYANEISKSLRCFPSSNPSMLMIGEVRDDTSAIELLRIAIDGHLVMTTMHSSDIVAALQRLISLASKGGMEKEARALLANSLKLVIHQRLDNKILQMTALQGDETVASVIQNGNLNSIKDLILRTQRRLQAL